MSSAPGQGGQGDCQVDHSSQNDCDELDPWECYDQAIRQDCCVTCDDVKNNIISHPPGCMYGDRAGNCTDYIQSTGPFRCYDTEFREACCLTCDGLETEIKSCRYGDRIGGCPGVIEDVHSRCYDNGTRHDCCDACFDLDSGIQGCEYGDRVIGCDSTVGPNGRFCYDGTIRFDCCDTCDSYETNIVGCKYGDRSGGCQASQCGTAQQLHDCCATCQGGGGTSEPSSTTWTGTITQDISTAGPPTAQPEKQGSNTPDWVVPVVASAAGVIVILVIILVVCFCLRRRRKKPEAINDKMYEEYKMSKRAPVAPPRPDETLDRRSQLQRQDTGIYAYINPEEVQSDPVKDSVKKNPGSEPPLPERPKEYVYLSNPDKYGYMEPSAKPSAAPSDPYTGLQERAPDPYTHLNPVAQEEHRRQNSYGEFPHAQQYDRFNNVVSERL